MQVPRVVTGIIRAPEISGAVMMPGGRLLLVSDEEGFFAVSDAAKQLRDGDVKPDADKPLARLDKQLDVDDLEDVTFDARHGCAYAITSHSLNKNSKAKMERRAVVRLAFGSRGELLDSRRFDGLFEAMTRLPLLQKAAHRTPRHGGLNIEGLEVSPEGDLLIGLRAPLSDQGEALLLRLEKPEAIFAGGKAKLARALGGVDGEMRRLNLNGQGIRGMCHDAGGYWILSNESDDPDGQPRTQWTLWRWDGNGKPQEQARPEGVGLRNPEAICTLDVDGTPHLLMIEDGAKDSPYVLFPTAMLKAKE